MGKLNKLQRILVILICFVLGFGTAMFGLRQNSLSNPGYSAWTYIKYGLFEYPLTSARNVFSDISNLWHVYADNEYLNEQLAQQRSYKTLYEEEKNKNQELESLLEVQNALEDAKYVSATVLERSSKSWNQTITISAGSSSGVEKNMLVATSDGAVGLVEEVQSSTSIVRLFTTETMTNDIAVKMSMEDGTSVEGVLESYDAKRNAYKVYLLNETETVAIGQNVATSGKGGNYPSGIFVGTVVDIKMNDDAIVSTVYVKPATNISGFDYCLVIGSGVAQ
ncbi:MAG: rod shape-determining protein MreC [Firmicutes bacterium]|nr:rod shape-determining protein MreC [Bacillota bacterium]